MANSKQSNTGSRSPRPDRLQIVKLVVCLERILSEYSNYSSGKKQGIKAKDALEKLETIYGFTGDQSVTKETVRTYLNAITEVYNSLEPPHSGSGRVDGRDTAAPLDKAADVSLFPPERVYEQIGARGPIVLRTHGIEDDAQGESAGESRNKVKRYYFQHAYNPEEVSFLSLFCDDSSSQANNDASAPNAPLTDRLLAQLSVEERKQVSPAMARVPDYLRDTAPVLKAVRQLRYAIQEHCLIDFDYVGTRLNDDDAAIGIHHYYEMVPVSVKSVDGRWFLMIWDTNDSNDEVSLKNIRIDKMLEPEEGRDCLRIPKVSSRTTPKPLKHGVKVGKKLLNWRDYEESFKVAQAKAEIAFRFALGRNVGFLNTLDLRGALALKEKLELEDLNPVRFTISCDRRKAGLLIGYFFHEPFKWSGPNKSKDDGRVKITVRVPSFLERVMETFMLRFSEFAKIESKSSRAHKIISGTLKSSSCFEDVGDGSYKMQESIEGCDIALSLQDFS